MHIAMHPLVYVFLVLFASSLAAAEEVGKKQVYIVHLGASASTCSIQALSQIHMEHLASALGSEVAAEEAHLYSYTKTLNGFCALLHPEAAAALRERPGVQSVFPSRMRKITTTRSWEFLGLNGSDPQGLWPESAYGKGVIVGLLDTGVWPESRSFVDAGMPPVPARWMGGCSVGYQFNASTCNRKLIGGKYYYKAFEAAHGPVTGYKSARDDNGHGTHTSSTATGRRVSHANVNGLAAGDAVGGAPMAHLAMYKVCWNNGDCSDGDMLAAIDDAVADGVDILSISIGNDNPQPQFYEDAVAIGLFHAVRKGIFASGSAGNSGTPASATNLAPWITTVAASSVDRLYVNQIQAGPVEDGCSANFSVSAVAISLTLAEYVKPWIPGAGRGIPSPLVYGGDIPISNTVANTSKYCRYGDLDLTNLNGSQVILCERDPVSNYYPFVGSQYVSGIIVISCHPETQESQERVAYPATLVTPAIGAKLVEYIRSTRSATVLISLPTTEVNGPLTRPTPLMGSFSSMGPNSLTPHILKPDITAPGVNILASYSPDNEFKMISGTSMACPHVAGAAALLKAIHPEWSPAAIRSALMTTATPYDNTGEIIRDARLVTATPFNYGSGLVQPTVARDPGLVYDIRADDYLAFLCTLGYSSAQIKVIAGQTFFSCFSLPKLTAADLNYPSISVSKLPLGKTQTVTRTVTNVGPAGKVVYRAIVQAPPGVILHVVPPVLVFKAVRDKLTYQITFNVTESTNSGEPVFGQVAWTDGIHVVSSPITVHT